MGKFKCSSKASRAYKSAKNFGHCKTRVNVGSHMKVTVGTKGIHTSIKAGPVTYKPGSGNYSVKTPIKNVKYYGNIHNNSNPNPYNNRPGKMNSGDYSSRSYYDASMNVLIMVVLLVIRIMFF